MSTEANGGFWARSGPTGWATRWLFGTALGQVIFTGTTRLVMAVLMGATVGGLAVWLVLRRRSPRPGYARPGHPSTAAAGLDDERVRRRHHGPVPTPAYRGRQPHPNTHRGRPRFSPRAQSPGAQSPRAQSPGAGRPRPTGSEPGRPLRVPSHLSSPRQRRGPEVS